MQGVSFAYMENPDACTGCTNCAVSLPRWCNYGVPQNLKNDNTATMGDIKLMKGNEAFAEAAIRSGCDAYFGYPITPQSEVMEYLAVQEPQKRTGMVLLQAESEVAAINMVYGAAGTGKRVMTSSSSPGISLKQEGISYIAGSELPCLILNVMRADPVRHHSAFPVRLFSGHQRRGHGDYRDDHAPASVRNVRLRKTWL
jgi:2-oxoglutarate ferredoxin oxidoreductase subunit alpha